MGRRLPCEVLGFLVVVLLAANATADRVDPRMATLRQLRAAAKCDDAASPWRPWCFAADVFDKGAFAELPKPRVMMGITVELAYGGDVAKALRDKVTLAAFAIDDDGKVKLVSLRPENDAEKRQMTEAIVNLTMVFKDKAKSAKLPDDLATYVKRLRGAFTPAKTASSWTWHGEKDSVSDAVMRKVGSMWVVIETPPHKDGIFATVLTDAWE
jgi:hypothetical protein